MHIDVTSFVYQCPRPRIQSLAAVEITGLTGVVGVSKEGRQITVVHRLTCSLKNIPFSVPIIFNVLTKITCALLNIRGTIAQVPCCCGSHVVDWYGWCVCCCANHVFDWYGWCVQGRQIYRQLVHRLTCSLLN